MMEINWQWRAQIVMASLLAASAACGSEVSTPPSSATGGAGGAGGAYEPSHCVGLDRDACCAENVNGCLWMEFEIGTQTRRGECAAEQDMCKKDRDDDCPDGRVCRTKFATGICDEGTDVPMGVCYSPEKWDCPADDSSPCTWIGD